MGITITIMEVTIAATTTTTTTMGMATLGDMAAQATAEAQIVEVVDHTPVVETMEAMYDQAAAGEATVEALMEVVALTIVDQVERIPMVEVDITAEIVSTATMDTILEVDTMEAVDPMHLLAVFLARAQDQVVGATVTQEQELVIRLEEQQQKEELRQVWISFLLTKFVAIQCAS